MKKIMVSEIEWYKLRALNEQVKSIQGHVFFRLNEDDCLQMWNPPRPVKQQKD